MTKNVTAQTLVGRRYAGRYRTRTMPTPPTGTLTSYTIENSESTTSKGFAMFVIPFGRGIVTPLVHPVLMRGSTRIDAQFDDIVKWDDGSIRQVVCSIRDTDFSGSESRTYDISLEVAEFDNTGTRSLSDITSNTDLNIQLTGNQRWNGSANEADPLGTTLSASFNTHSAINTRVKRMQNSAVLGNRVRSGPVMEEFEVWGTFQNGSATQHPHLKCTWNVRIWKNSDGSIADYEYCATVEQDWWNVADKYRQDYSAQLFDGVTSVHDYGAKQHYYRGWWATRDMSNVDTRHARYHWKNSAPTLNVVPPYQYWIDCKHLPPYNLSRSSLNNATYSSTYVPFDQQSHRYGINSAGNYMGRAYLPDSDVVAIMSPTAFNHRVAIVNAHAGLSVAYHYRSNDNATTAQGTDTANTILPLILRPKPTSFYDYSDRGLPAPKDAYLRTPEPSQGILIDYIEPNGGAGQWVPAEDASHAVNYCEFAYLITGDRVFQRAIKSLLMNVQHQQRANAFGGNPPLLYGLIRPDDVSQTRWGGVCQTNPTQTRSLGWSLVMMNSALKCLPEEDLESDWIRVMLDHNFDYISESIDTLPADMINNGLYAYEALSTPWQQGFVAQGVANLYASTNDARVRKLFNLSAKYLELVATQGGRYFQSFNLMQQLIAGPASALSPGATRFQDGTLDDGTPYTAGPLLAPGGFYAILVDGFVTNNVLTLDPATGKVYNVPLNEGAEVVFYIKSTNQAALRQKPTQLSWGTVYHVRAGGRLSATPTGPLLTLDDINGDANRLTVSGASGTFQEGETVTGGTSGATARLAQVTTTGFYYLTDITGTFQNAETITGGTSSATATIASQFTTPLRVSVAIRDPAFATYTIAMPTADGGADGNYLPGPIFEAAQLKAHIILINELDSTVLSDTLRDKVITYCQNVVYDNAGNPSFSFYGWEYVVQSGG